MASVTYDGRSFMLDGRRVWIVGGSVHYARLPREEWAGRIALARQAGLNAIETPVVWSRHEARPGQFDFTGDNDLRHFMRLVGDAGMHAILRVGPFIGSGYDAGGIPAWLVTQTGVEPRTASAPFLEACSRFISAVAGQVKDLQVSSPGRGGPILLVQSEHGWTCGNDALAQSYLGELLRYIRESGITVPVLNANGLWQSVEGEIECWSGADDLLAISRQLAEIAPRQPRLVVDLRLGQATAWGQPEPAVASPEAMLRSAAEALAGVSQFVLNPFAGGHNFGFSAGRSAQSPELFLTTRQDHGALIAADGEGREALGVLRRITMFASRFGRVLAHLDPEDRPPVLAPSAGEDGPTVVPARGSQGSVVFVFGKVGKRGKPPTPATLVLRDGSTLEVPIGTSGTAWCLFDVLLAGRSQLDYCSLSAFAAVGGVFVCFGPAGSRGVVSVNGSPLEVGVPTGKNPEVLQHEGVCLVVANEEQLDTIQITDEGVMIGVTGLTLSGAPIAAASGRQYTFIGTDGVSTARRAEGSRGKTPGTKALSAAWEWADTASYASGESPRFAAIDGPADLSTLGAPYGYGWYRLQFRSSGVKRVRIAAPAAADRLHLFLDGQSVGVLGRGPGSVAELTLQLKKAQHTLVALAENLGRPSGGPDLKPAKGLFGELYELAAFKAGRAKIVEAAPIELLSFRVPLWEVRTGDVTHPRRASWSFIHRKKTPILVRMEEVQCRGLVVLNGKPIHFFEPGADNSLLLSHEVLSRGNNTLELAVATDSVAEAGLADLLATLSKHVTVLEGTDTLGGKVEWAFAQWEPPTSASYDPLSKPSKEVTGPAWFRAEFDSPEPDRQVILGIAGLSKGQIYLNGRHVGRYFATTGGKAVGPYAEQLLPASWLVEGGVNELVLFDEHGGDPSKCTLSAVVRRAEGA
ncbi:MAG: beta-galactosidase [Phycisphaerales bacterium]|nr:beta-galactosidase [Phycisphaerales bacterium]